MAENCRQLERANAAMELQLERAKASGAHFVMLFTFSILDDIHAYVLVQLRLQLQRLPRRFCCARMAVGCVDASFWSCTRR